MSAPGSVAVWTVSLPLSFSLLLGVASAGPLDPLSDQKAYNAAQQAPAAPGEVSHYSFKSCDPADMKTCANAPPVEAYRVVGSDGQAHWVTADGKDMPDMKVQGFTSGDVGDNSMISDQTATSTAASSGQSDTLISDNSVTDTGPITAPPYLQQNAPSSEDSSDPSSGAVVNIPTWADLLSTAAQGARSAPAVPARRSGTGVLACSNARVPC